MNTQPQMFWGVTSVGCASILGILTLGGVSPFFAAMFYFTLVIATILQVLIIGRRWMGTATRSRIATTMELIAVLACITYLGLDLASFHHFAQRTSVHGVRETLPLYAPEITPRTN